MRTVSGVSNIRALREISPLSITHQDGDLKSFPGFPGLINLQIYLLHENTAAFHEIGFASLI